MNKIVRFYREKAKIILVKQQILEQIRDLSPRARARVRARAETHRVIVLDLTTRPSRDPIFGPLLERVCHRSPRIRSIFGLEGEKRGPKMTLFWGTGIPGSWDTGNWTTFGSYYDIS